MIPLQEQRRKHVTTSPSAASKPCMGELNANAFPTAASKPCVGEFNAQGILWGYSAIGHTRDSLQILQGWVLQGFFGDILGCTPGTSLGQPRDFLEDLGFGTPGIL